jgi:hypothetical protein
VVGASGVTEAETSPAWVHREIGFDRESVGWARRGARRRPRGSVREGGNICWVVPVMKTLW